MLNEILEIPGNRPVFDDLQRLLAGKKAIAFVGAGVSHDRPFHHCWCPRGMSVSRPNSPACYQHWWCLGP